MVAGKFLKKFNKVGVVLLVFMTLFAAGASFAYRLPDTGQEKCFDGSKEIPCPSPGEPYYGQDGNYEGPQPSFLDNSNGTVTDLNTGLIWQQGDAQNSSYRSWQEAVDYCDSLTLAGYSDWRLPTVTELTSLTNIGRYDPAIDTAYFPDARSDFYWSGSTYAHYTVGAWIVNFYNGYVGWSFKGLTHYARCIRSGS